MVQAAILVGQHGDRRVVAHRADGFLRVLHHRVQDQFQLLQREADRELAAAQRLGIEAHRLRRVGFDDVVDRR